MADEASGLHVVFNGEIYNFAALRAELEAAGTAFRSSSDTEVLLQGYRRWGEAVVSRLRGMFAFAIWDERARTCFLARDRLGIKPLVYASVPGGLVFASEIKALFAHPGLSVELEPPAVDRYLALGYVPGPGTIFRHVLVLSPGCWLRWREGTVETGRYWEPDFSAGPLQGNEADLVEELDRRLSDAVVSHLVADVPVGAFVSGGVDSSLVAAIAAKHLDTPLHTFTIGFEGGGDERAYARRVSGWIGSAHHERLAEPEIEAQVPRLVWHMDQPLFDNSMLPTFLVSSLAREWGKVVLSGDGGDEPFFGYDWTRWALRLPSLPLPRRHAGWEGAYRAGWAGLAGRLYDDLSRTADERYLRRMTVPAALRAWLYRPEFSERLGALEAEPLRLPRDGLRDARDRFVRADLAGFLVDDILLKVDRMSMACGLEVRVPLLDHRLLEWVLRLPVPWRFREGRGKYLLRQVAGRYLPPDILQPRKQGFTVPIGRWLHGPLGLLVERLFASRRFAERGLIRPERARHLLDLHRSRRYDLGHRLWSLAILEIWCRIWLDRQTPDQSIRTLLAETGDAVCPNLS